MIRPVGAAGAILALLALAGCGHLIPRGQSRAVAALPAGEYRLDPDHASVLFKIDHLGFSQLVGRFNEIEASLDFDPAAAAAARLVVVIQTASLDLGLPAFEDELRGGSWFEVDRFPEARFESTTIEITDASQGKITGDLSLHGVSAPVTLDVTFNGGGDSLLTGRYTLGFAATGVLSRSAFGLGSFAPAVGDQVELEIHAEFQRVRGLDS